MKPISLNSRYKTQISINLRIPYDIRYFLEIYCKLFKEQVLTVRSTVLLQTFRNPNEIIEK